MRTKVIFYTIYILDREKLEVTSGGSGGGVYSGFPDCSEAKMHAEIFAIYTK